MKRKSFYEFPELELTEFKSEEGVFSSTQIESVKGEDELADEDYE